MYQRYYKQRRFGRIFSFVLVVGSGLSYYLKTSLKSIQSSFQVENLLKNEEYMPSSCKTILHNLNEIKTGHVNIADYSDKIKDFYFTKKDTEKEFIRNNKWIFINFIKNEYRANLYKKKENFDLYKYDRITYEDAKTAETYHIYKKIKNKI